MASSFDITPALGHGILTAQGQAGGYDAIDDRRMWGVGRQEGATSALAYKVTAGAGLTLDVATDQGHFLVQGDNVDWQGLYMIPATALPTTLDLAAAPDPTNPRVDQVVLEARDDAHTFDGITRGRVYVLSGTPTSGADVVDSVAYGSSKAALPPSTALLAEFVVGAGATTIGALRDRRATATGASKSALVDSGDAIGLSSANWGEPLGAGALALTMECSGAPVVFRFSGSGAGNGTTPSVFVGLSIDGDLTGALLTSRSRFIGGYGPNLAFPVAGEFRVTPSAGRHTFALKTRTLAGNYRIFASATNGAFEVSAVEDLTPEL